MSDSHDFMDIDRKEAREQHDIPQTAIEGHLVYDYDQKRYLLNGKGAFAQLASLIGMSVPADVTLDGRDYGRVRITVQVVLDEDDPDDRELSQSDRAFLISGRGGPNA